MDHEKKHWLTTNKGVSKNNLTLAEREAIKSPSSNSSIVILPADKGGAIVIQDVPTTGMKLQDNMTDTLLSTDPTFRFKCIIDSMPRDEEPKKKLHISLQNTHNVLLYTPSEKSIRLNNTPIGAQLHLPKDRSYNDEQYLWTTS